MSKNGCYLIFIYHPWQPGMFCFSLPLSCTVSMGHCALLLTTSTDIIAFSFHTGDTLLISWSELPIPSLSLPPESHYSPKNRITEMLSNLK